MSLGDGRSLCMECLGSAVMDTGECQPLYHSIRDYYEGMNMKLDQQIPMLLVERQALNEAMEGESRVSISSGFFPAKCAAFGNTNVHHICIIQGPHHMPETRGLCLSEEQTVSSVSSTQTLTVARMVNHNVAIQSLAEPR